MINILELENSQREIDIKRKEISTQFMVQSKNIKTDKIKSISTKDLYTLFGLYDSVFFDNWFNNSFNMPVINFSLSKRMTRSAGLTLCPKQVPNKSKKPTVFEIRIGVDFFFNYELIDGSKKVCGLDTHSSLEALQLVFEHEICHVLEFIHFEKSSCRGKRFKTIANNIFGHTDSHHQLPTHRCIADQQLGLKVGDTVSFKLNDQLLTGVIYNIKKRATVMVRSKTGPYADRQGNRYCKYYVPLRRLMNTSQ